VGELVDPRHRNLVEFLSKNLDHHLTIRPTKHDHSLNLLKVAGTDNLEFILVQLELVGQLVG